MSLKKRFKYAYRVFKTNPLVLEWHLSQLQELAEPVEDESNIEYRLNRQRGRLLKVEESATTLINELDIDKYE